MTSRANEADVFLNDYLKGLRDITRPYSGFKVPALTRDYPPEFDGTTLASLSSYVTKMKEEEKSLPSATASHLSSLEGRRDPLRDFFTRTTCNDIEEEYLDRLQRILGALPTVGVPAEITKITEGVFLGTLKEAEDLESLRHYGITHVLNTVVERKLKTSGSLKGRAYNYSDSGVRGYLQIDAEDSEQHDISSHFRFAFSWMWKARKEGGQILIVDRGVSRAGAIAIGYLVWRGMYLLKAAKLVKDLRRNALCNTNFMKNLVSYAREQRMLDPKPEAVKAPRFGGAHDKYRLNRAHLPDVHIGQTRYKAREPEKPFFDSPPY